MPAPIEDTYAEAFRSLFAEVIVTARDRVWLDHACATRPGTPAARFSATAKRASPPYLDPADTPDGRPGAVLQFHVPRFRKDREQALYQSLLARVSQNVLTCPTAAAFSPMADDVAAGRSIPLGRKIAYFGDGHEFEDRRHGRDVWVIPILAGEFVMDRDFGFRDGIMGGNLWFLGETADAALDAGAAAVAAVAACDGVIAPFPGGLAGSRQQGGIAV